MAKVTASQPTRNQLKTGKLLNQNSVVTSVTNYFNEIDSREDFEGKWASGEHIEKSWLRSVTPPEKQASRPTPAKRLLALIESGTQCIGEDHPRAILTDAQVEEIGAGTKLTQTAART